MDTTQYHDEELRQLFGRLPEKKPSAGFTARVMAQVAIEKQRAVQRKRMQMIAWVVSIPCSLAFLLIAGYLTRNYWETYLWEFFEPLLTSLGNTVTSIICLFPGNGYRFFLPGLVFLTLLLGDLFIRHYVDRKKSDFYF